MISASKEDQSRNILANNQVVESNQSDEPHVCESDLCTRIAVPTGFLSNEPKAVGIDLGITTFATLSTGEKIDNLNTSSKPNAV